MARHAPPTNRSFYLSVAASTVRFALIVALIVGGVVVINQAFPEGVASSDGGGGAVPTGGGGPMSTGPTTPTGATGETTQEPVNTPSPQVQGVRVAVFNTTGISDLAGELMTELEADGYVEGQEPDDATTSAETRIYFRSPQDEIEADHIANTYFRRLNIVVSRLEPGSDVAREVQVAIFLGNDYAQIA